MAKLNLQLPPQQKEIIMDNVAQVTKKTSYGRGIYTPMNDVAEAMSRVLGNQTTLTDKNLADFKVLGFEFHEVAIAANGAIVTMGSL